MAARRFLRLLTMLALLLMPLAMISGHPAMASEAHAATAADHCAGMEKQQKRDLPGRKGECMTGCACILDEAGGLDDEAIRPIAAERLPLAPALQGLHPEAATPPPRIA
jgi:hypothetical protein